MDDEAEELKPVPSLTAEEMRGFVKDYTAGKIFCLQDLPLDRPEQARSTFMVLALGGFGDIDPKDVGTIYEYYAKAMPTAINGYPVFMSCKLIGKADWAKVSKTIIQIADQQRDILSTAFKEPEDP